MGGRWVVPVYALDAPASIAIWSGASRTEVAEGYAPAGHGLFTYFLLQALEGQADLGSSTQDGRISLEEAATWTMTAVRKVSNFRQTPELLADAGMRGIDLAPSPEPPSPLDLTSMPYSAQGPLPPPPSVLMDRRRVVRRGLLYGSGAAGGVALVGWGLALAWNGQYEGAVSDIPGDTLDLTGEELSSLRRRANGAGYVAQASTAAALSLAGMGLAWRW